MDVINLDQKFSLFNEHWTPKLLTEVNGQVVKIAKVKGEFIWHNHKGEDELFFIIKGQLKIEFESETKIINEGEILVVPKGVEHKPIAEEEVWLLLFEPMNTKHTGEVQHELTQETIEKI